MSSTPAEAMTAIADAGLPPVFTDIWHGELPPAIKHVCERPTRYFTILEDIRVRFPRAAEMVPLWEMNREEVVGYDQRTGEFLRYHYAPPGDEHEVLGDAYQRFLTTFFAELIDSGLWEELDDLAERFRYRHLSRLKATVEDTTDATWKSDLEGLTKSIHD